MKLLEKSARSEKSDATTVTISSSSHENTSGAPKKPQRVKSGYLFEQKDLDASEQPRRKQSYDYSEKESKSVTEQSHMWHDSEDGKDKWCALNDSKPDTVKRRVQRVIRTNSDSDLSEASTIDSSSGPSNKGNSRKGEIRARNKERKVRQEQRAALKNGTAPEENHQQELELDLDEDDDLVDTDKDMPISEVNEQLALRKKRAEARRSPKKLRGKSPHADSGGRPKSARRAGKKEEILTVPNGIAGDERSHTKSFSKKRQTNPDKQIRRKTKSETPDIFSTNEDSAQGGQPLTRSSSADKIGRRNVNLGQRSYSSGFHMLLGDSQKDFMLNTATLRPENDSWRNRDSSSHIEDPLSPSQGNRKQSSRRSLSPKPNSYPRRDMLAKSRKPQSDRFLCASTTSDFAPRLSSRRLNASADDDEYDATPKRGKPLDYFVTKEQSKVRKTKKDGARSVDDTSRRRKPKT